ncbi:hypothetical protein AOLI_G00025910 [Acnodon oligacanthus]
MQRLGPRLYQRDAHTNRGAHQWERCSSSVVVRATLSTNSTDPAGRTASPSSRCHVQLALAAPPCALTNTHSTGQQPDKSAAPLSAELPLKEPSPAALRRRTAGGVCVVSGFCACVSACQGSAGGREGSDFSGLVILWFYMRGEAGRFTELLDLNAGQQTDSAHEARRSSCRKAPVRAARLTRLTGNRPRRICLGLIQARYREHLAAPVRELGIKSNCSPHPYKSD